MSSGDTKQAYSADGDKEESYESKRARNNEAVRKCRSKKRQEQEFKDKRMLYMERGWLLPS